MDFPVKLYHADHAAFIASGYPTYPIVVQSEDEFLGLPEGWFADPVEAGNYPQVLQRRHDAKDAAPVVAEPVATPIVDTASVVTPEATATQQPVEEVFKGIDVDQVVWGGQQ